MGNPNSKRARRRRAQRDRREQAYWTGFAGMFGFNPTADFIAWATAQADEVRRVEDERIVAEMVAAVKAQGA